MLPFVAPSLEGLDPAARHAEADADRTASGAGHATKHRCSSSPSAAEHGSGRRRIWLDITLVLGPSDEEVAARARRTTRDAPRLTPARSRRAGTEAVQLDRDRERGRSDPGTRAGAGGGRHLRHPRRRPSWLLGSLQQRGRTHRAAPAGRAGVDIIEPDTAVETDEDRRACAAPWWTGFGPSTPAWRSARLGAGTFTGERGRCAAG